MHPGFTPFHRGGSGPPLVCLHGFTDTWRTWELALEALERRHEVLAPTLAGHAGGPPLREATDSALADEVERAMDDAGFDTAHVVGNSLGGYLALKLAERGRARSVVALAPAGGWPRDDATSRVMARYFPAMQAQVRELVDHADAIASTPEGRRRATGVLTERSEHIPPDLVAHMMRGVAACEVRPLVDGAVREGYGLDPEAITCPVRVVWGTADRLLRWPASATRYRSEWLPAADWVELEGVGHCPQLDVPLETAELVAGFAAG